MARGQSRGVRVQSLSLLNILATLVLAALCMASFVAVRDQFQEVVRTSKKYVTAENSVAQLKSSFDYLAEEAKLAVMTRDRTYANLYFDELDLVNQRGNVLDDLGAGTVGNVAVDTMQLAMDRTMSLSTTDVYAMRLAMESSGQEAQAWPTRVRETQLSAEDESLSSDEKADKAIDLLSNEPYLDMRAQINQNMLVCSQTLVSKMNNRQISSANAFQVSFMHLGVSVAAFVLLTVLMCFALFRLMVRPLLRFNEKIEEGSLLPEEGAAELKVLTRTYNRVFTQNKEIQRVIKYQAEHDGLTGLLNRGAFDKLLAAFEAGDRPFALTLCDVDTFKQVNDGHGHAAGDKILKLVATLLLNAFRNVDYVCRIGGDEFAVIMVEMTTDLAYTIESRVVAINEQLADPDPDSGLPPVSLSVGVAFTDRENPGESLYKDADAALYFTKEHGRAGCTTYGDDEVVRL